MVSCDIFDSCPVKKTATNTIRAGDWFTGGSRNENLSENLCTYLHKTYVHITPRSPRHFPGNQRSTAGPLEGAKSPSFRFKTPSERCKPASPWPAWMRMQRSPCDRSSAFNARLRRIANGGPAPTNRTVRIASAGTRLERGSNVSGSVVGVGSFMFLPVRRIPNAHENQL